ncbi:MAG TPA: DUF4845 domain-containing protein [Porticoccaceae bacterium]|nr:DUF4845 domain-containing protein [Porticoccaceae bacterium]HCO60329.1 DUF4845 domain-containing protein [Porticoccaceae bacterium]
MLARKQRGLSALGFLIVLAIGGFFLTALFKVGPMYLDNYFVQGAMNTLADEKVHEMTDARIRRKIGDSFTINNVRDVDVKKVQIVREKTRTLVKLDYEKRVNFLGNLDVVVAFNNVYDSSVQ